MKLLLILLLIAIMNTDSDGVECTSPHGKRKKLFLCFDFGLGIFSLSLHGLYHIRTDKGRFEFPDFTNCSTHLSCSECVSSQLSCQWCVDGHQCTNDIGERSERSCRYGTVVNSVNVSVQRYRVVCDHEVDQFLSFCFRVTLISRDLHHVHQLYNPPLKMLMKFL